MCVSTLNIRDPNGTKTSQRITVPCGKCHECLKAKRVAWSFRLEQQYKICTSAYFITLTYDDDNIIWGLKEQTLVKNEISNFIKRLRKHEGKLEKGTPPIKYYGVGEYGGKTKRPHYHIILFNVNKYRNVTKSWKKGIIHVDIVNSRTIQYTTNYVISKETKFSGKEGEFSVMSKNLGLNYVKTHAKYHAETETQTVKLNNGAKITIPRYLKDKVFSKYDKKRYAIRTQKQLDLAEKKYNEYCKSKGLKPEKNKIEQINNSIRKFNKNSKNGNI